MAAAQEAAADTAENIGAGTAEQVAAGKSEEGQEKIVEDTSCNDTGNFECEVCKDSVIPQIDGNDDLKDDDKVYELKIEAHEKCKNHDIVEAIEVNFDGTLDDRKVEKNDSIRNICVQKSLEKQASDKENRNLQTYTVVIKKGDITENIIEGWKKIHNFDDFAFRGSDCKNIRIRIREVQNLR